MLPLKDNISSKRFPFVNLIFILTNIFCFFYEIYLGKGVNDLILTYGVIPIKFVHFYNLTLKDFFLPLVFSIFLHGGWIHLGSNMLYLWIFGDNIEDKLGHFKYFFFYLFCGIIASFIYIVFSPLSNFPCIGASGAIAGVLGAYFITFPKAKVFTLVPIWFFLKVIQIPAFIVLGLWFILQCLNGTAMIAQTTLSSNVAWWAHIGGFLSGMFLIKWLEK